MSTTEFTPSEQLREMRDDVVYLEAELRNIHTSAEGRSLDDDENARFADGMWLRHALIAEGMDMEARERAAASFTSGAFEPGDGNTSTPGAPAFHRDVDPYDSDHIRSVGSREAARQAIDQCRAIGGDEKTEMERKLNASVSDPHLRGFDQYILRHNSEDYSRGVIKLINGRGWEMTSAEVEAVRSTQQWDEERGISLTTANGGALIPAHLDPTIILTNVGTSNPFRAISRVVPMSVNVWNGVLSAGATFAWSTEGGDSSDIAPTFLQKSITAHKAHGTVPATIESFEDIQGLGGQVAEALRDGKDRLEAAAFTYGSGSGQPKGVITALYPETSRWESHTTHSAFTSTDLVDAQNMLGPRFQPNASWLASLTYHNRVRAFGDSYWEQTVTLDEAASGRLLGKPAYEASDMSTALSTATNPAFVYGDFNNYVIADRIGMAVDFIPHLFSPGNGLPNGRVGWYAHWRVGADVVNNTAFVLSVNPGIT